MPSLFADTLYWIAIANPRDPWAARARQSARGRGLQVVTTEAVLVEFLDFVCEQGEHVRRSSAALFRSIIRSPRVNVVAVDSALFLRELELYEARPDKGYSLVDCISMVTMRELRLRQVLSADRHFAQEGFETLLAR